MTPLAWPVYVRAILLGAKHETPRNVAFLFAARGGFLELKQASQRCSRRRGLHLFEPAGVRGTVTVTENDRKALTQAARSLQSPDQFLVRGKLRARFLMNPNYFAERINSELQVLPPSKSQRSAVISLAIYMHHGFGVVRYHNPISTVRVSAWRVAADWGEMRARAGLAVIRSIALSPLATVLGRKAASATSTSLESHPNQRGI